MLVAAASAIFALLVSVYWRPLSAPFLDYDSIEVVYSQAALRSLSSTPYLLSTDYFRVFGEGGYRPLTTLAYMMTFRLFGAEPLAFKLVKLAVVVACAFWVFMIALQLVRDRRWAATAAVVYFFQAVPQAFAGVAFYPDLLAPLFGLASISFFIRSEGEERPWRSRLTSLLLYLLATLAKETSVLLPGAFLAYRVFLGGQWRGLRKETRDQAPFWLAAASYLLLVRYGIRAESFYGPVRWDFSSPVSWLPAKLVRYAAIFYSPSDPLAFLLALSAALALLWRAPRRELAMSSAFLASWFILSILPITGAFPFPKFSTYLAPVDPRYLAMGGAALACWLAALGASLTRWPRAEKALLFLVGIRLLMMAAGSLKLERLGVRSPARLATDAARDALGSPLELPLYSLSLIRSSDPVRFAAIERAAEKNSPPWGKAEFSALFLTPSLYRDPLRAREAAFVQRSTSSAVFWSRLDAVTKLPDPDCPAKLRSMLDAGDVIGALESEGRCVPALNTEEGRGDSNSGLAAMEGAASSLVRSGSYPEAARAYDRIVFACGSEEKATRSAFERRALTEACDRSAREARLLKSGARARFELAMADIGRGRPEQARRGFSKAIEASPEFAEAWLSRGALQARDGDLRGALRDYDRGLALPSTDEVRRALVSSRASAAKRLAEAP